MKFARVTRVGAYVCPRGAFAIECRNAPSGVEVERTLDAPFGLKTPEEAADHLVSVLQSSGIVRASVSITGRGSSGVRQVWTGLWLPSSQSVTPPSRPVAVNRRPSRE